MRNKKVLIIAGLLVLFFLNVKYASAADRDRDKETTTIEQKSISKKQQRKLKRLKKRTVKSMKKYQSKETKDIGEGLDTFVDFFDFIDFFLEYPVTSTIIIAVVLAIGCIVELFA